MAMQSHGHLALFSAVKKLQDLVNAFSIKEAGWTTMTVHGEDYEGLVSGIGESISLT